MRYVANKITVVKIVDQQITDIDLIRDILVFIKEKELDCAVRLLEQNLFNKVRIVNIDGDDITCHIIKSSACLKKHIKISDIAYLELTTEDRILNNFKPGTTRWNLLSASDIDETGI